MRPDKSIRARSLVRRWGLMPAAAYALAAIRYPENAAIIDEHGTQTFAEVHRRTDALAHALRAAAIDERHTVAIMCRNHRGFIEATLACSKIGANVVYLDPGAAPSTLADVARREDSSALIYDEDFSELLRSVGRGRRRFIAWCEPDRHARYPLLEELIARERSVSLMPAGKRRRSTVMLACQRPGSASDAPRKLPSSLMIPGAVMSRIPLRPRQTTLIAAPMFARWGFLHFTLGLRLASTLVLRREFDPNEVLASVDEHKVSALAVLPEMLEAIMELPEASSACHDTEALRVIAVQGPGLRSELAFPAIERFGDVFYNLRGSIVVELERDWVQQIHAVRQQAHRVAILG
jgi:fatty-acyl-CoA synthase